MHKTISFKFDNDYLPIRFEVIIKKEEKTSESSPTFLFLKFLKANDYIDSIDNILNSSDDLRLIIFSNFADIKSKEIKEKAQELGLKVFTIA